MKRTSIAIVGILSASIVALSSCSLFFAPKGAMKPGYGSLNVNLPFVAPWVLRAAAQMGGRGLVETGRALVVADSASFVVTQGSTVVTQWTVGPKYGSVTGAATPTVGSNSIADGTVKSLPVGDYTITLSVFNTSNSSSDPVVRGTATFTIADGKATDVAIHCTPVSTGSNAAGTLVVGTALTSQTLGTPWQITGSGSTQTVVHGGERWYSFAATSALTAVTLTPQSGSTAMPLFMVYESTGKSIMKGQIWDPSQAATIAFDSSKGSTYYLVAIDRAGTTTSVANRNVDILVKEDAVIADFATAIPDANLRAALAATLGTDYGITKTWGSITQGNLQMINGFFKAEGKGIADLTGIGLCANLTWFSFGDNAISDLTPLASLRVVQMCNLWDNKLSTIAPLANLAHPELLHFLDLNGNSVPYSDWAAAIKPAAFTSLWQIGISGMTKDGLTRLFTVAQLDTVQIGRAHV